MEPHRCGEHNCSWHWVSPTEVTVCQRCNSRYIYKYGIFNCTHRLVSDWWLDPPCDAWFYFCTVCKGFYSRKTHCCDRGCLDVYALKRDRLTRSRFKRNTDITPLQLWKFLNLGMHSVLVTESGKGFFPFDL